MALTRLQKLLSERGVASRRKAEDLIAQGKVRVNGHPAKLGDSADPYRDLVTVSAEGQRRPPSAGGRTAIRCSRLWAIPVPRCLPPSCR